MSRDIEWTMPGDVSTVACSRCKPAPTLQNAKQRLFMTKLRTLKPGIRTLDTRIAKPAHTSGQRIAGRTRMNRNKRLAASNPLCAECERNGRVSAVDEWDHIVPLWRGGSDTEANLQGLCRECHSQKTAQEAAERLKHGGAS